jgi:alkyldihydroxyacetonephosphate synthase
MAIVDEECAAATVLDTALVERWLGHRNDVSALAPLWRAGIVVDTVEMAGSWRVLPALSDAVIGALKEIPGTLAASVHQSHAYGDGACLYFTFAGRRPDTEAARDGASDLAWEEAFYHRAWDTVTDIVIERGAAISHHHGIGLNRGRFLPKALGSSFAVFEALKRSLDPHGILNPGKLGLASDFGPVDWP